VTGVQTSALPISETNKDAGVLKVNGSLDYSHVSFRDFFVLQLRLWENISHTSYAYDE
jgi:hypothetical protein